MKLQTFAFGLWLGLASASTAFAATTTLTFDEFGHLDEVNSQYQAQGVLVSGVRAYDTRGTPWPANTGVYSAFSEQGLMTFTLDSSITGEVQEVSGYISGEQAVGIYAYDAGGTLVGQAVTPAAPNNVLLKITSTGAPITTVTVHNGGSTFLMDTLTLATAVVPPAPVCKDVAQQLIRDLADVPKRDFKNEAKRQTLFNEANRFAWLVENDVPDFRLRSQLYELRKDTRDWIKPSEKRKKVLDTIEQLLVMVDAQQC